MPDYLFSSYTRFLICLACLLVTSSCVYGQEDQNDRETELSMGVKVVARQIQYGKSNLFVTDPTSIGIQPVLRYDIPVRLTGTRYLALVAQTGFLFCKANDFDTVYFDPNRGIFVREHSKNPAYMPFYVGVYSISRFSIGSEIFYWKGLGNRNIWGAKFLSLGYNGRQFRFTIAGEWYAQVRNSSHSGTLLSFEIFLKLIRDKDYHPRPG